MDLDELRLTWQALDRRLERQMALELQRERRASVGRMRRSLWPLLLGQCLQILLGIAMIALGVAAWQAGVRMEGGMLNGAFVSGVLVHVYGVACIAFAGHALHLAARLDPACAVLELQQRLARLRRFHVLAGMWIGLVWWVFWVLFVAALHAIGPGGDLFAQQPLFVWSAIGGGVLGLLATSWFHRWSRDPRRPRLRQSMDDAVSGTSLRRAQAELDAFAAIDRE